MPISDIVQLTITSNSASVLRAGFGVPLIFGFSNRFAEKTRAYTSLAGMTADGFLASDAEYKAATKLLSQKPTVSKFYVARRELKPTMRWALTPVAANLYAYKVKVSNGTTTTTVSFTSDASATVTEVIAGLKIAIDALGFAITTSDQTTFLRIVANAAGVWFSVESLDIDKLGVAMDHGDPGVQTDLSAIELYNPNWYALLNVSNSAAEVASIAEWIEARTKLYVAATQDSTTATTVLAGATDIGASLKEDGYARTALIYHPSNADFADAAWAGKCLPLDAGSETWKFKTLSGVATTTLTTTHQDNLEDKYTNFYYDIADVGTATPGLTSANEWIDFIRGLDALHARIGEDLFLTFASAPKKIPFTDKGGVVVEAAIRGSLQLFVEREFLAEDPAFTVTVPAVADVDENDRAARHFSGVTFEAQAAGAIHTIAIAGTVIQ